VIVILGSRRRDLDQRGAVLRSRHSPDALIPLVGSRMHAAAEQTGFELLIRCDIGNVHDRVGPVRPVEAISARARRWAGDQAAVVAPIESDPWPPLSDLILKMGGRIEKLVVVDAEYATRAEAGGRCADPAHLRAVETGGDAGHHYERGEAVEVGHAGADGNNRGFWSWPTRSEYVNGSVAQHAEVISLVRVLPDIFPADDQIAPEGLLESRVNSFRQPGLSGAVRHG